MPRPPARPKPRKRSRAERASLSAQDWIEAALDAIAAGGLDAVAVEPLARKLRVTKGSFYWHFPDRAALIAAALAHWEKQETVDLIARAEQETAPRERLHTLFRVAANTDSRSERLLLVLSATDHPLTDACVRHITQRWLDYIQHCYRALGLEDTEARHWASFAFSTFMGTVRMRRDNPQALPSGNQFNEYLRFLIRSLLPRQTQGEHPSVVPLRRAGS